MRILGLASTLLLFFSAALSAQQWPPPGYVLVDDMALPEAVIHGDASFTATIWTGGVVHYRFDSAVTNGQQASVRKALDEIEAVCGAVFVIGGATNEIVFRQHPTETNVSSSSVGMIGGTQYVNVGSNHWGSKMILVHEVMHALGFIHEQSRPDRDTYVTINWSQIEPGREGNFQTVSGATNTGSYDFDSCMHYRQSAFAIGSAPTISCKPGYTQFQNSIGHLSYLSMLDAQGLANRYGAASAPVVTNILPNSAPAAGGQDVIIDVYGTRFYEGSPGTSGAPGSVVRFRGVALDTTYVASGHLQAVIPASMILYPDPTNAVTVDNATPGGGVSNGSNFAVTAPTCTTTYYKTGTSVAGLGDVDGDLYEDYLVGSPGANGAGRAECRSGRSGTPIWTLVGGSGYSLGQCVARLGDVTGDGISEALIGAPGYSSGRGLFRVLNGATGGVLFTIYGSASFDSMGFSLASAGDVTGDGIPDILAGIPGYGSGGAVEVRSGSNGALIRRHLSSTSNANLGWSVAGGHDTNSDGVPDYVAGSPTCDAINVGTDCGCATIYNGATGSNLASKVGSGAYDFFGTSVALVPGVSGTRAYTVVGAPESGSTFGGSSQGTGYIKIYRGWAHLTGYSDYRTRSGTSVGDRYGHSLAYVGDLNQDGAGDIAVGAPQNGNGGAGHFDLYSPSGDLLFSRFTSSSAGDRLGQSVAAAGDTDRDGRLEVIAGRPDYDLPCPDSGGYLVVDVDEAPVMERLMITEVSTYSPQAVEIANFSPYSVNLDGYKLHWRGGGLFPFEADLSGRVLLPGEILVVQDDPVPAAGIPGGVQVASAFPSIPVTFGGVVVALETNVGIMLDEVRVAGTGDADPLYSFGGLFRGYVRNIQPGPYAGPVTAERSWGLDSNGGSDWTSNASGSLGRETGGAGGLGFDPVASSAVVINEVSWSPTYIELKNRGALKTLSGWSLRVSTVQGNAHQRVTLPNITLGAGEFLVLGNGSSVPPEKPSLVPYRNLGISMPSLGNDEFSLALYDDLGRLVDIVRASGHDDGVVHNHPRAPSGWRDFQGAALRSGGVAIGRNLLSSDTDTENDWTALSARTMGSQNGSGPFTFVPSAEKGLDVRFHSGPSGIAFTLIMNAGNDHGGEKWSFLFDIGHLEGQGPLYGLGPNAINNYLWAVQTPPFSGNLDGKGSARLDFPEGSVPSGLDIDAIFILTSNPGGLLRAVSPIIEFDS